MSYTTDEYYSSHTGDSKAGSSELIYNATPTRRTRTETTTTESTRSYSDQSQVPAVSSFKDELTPEDFFRTKFYFTGMGSVIGTALSEGVHVEERHRDRAVEPDHTSAILKDQLYKDEYPLVSSCGKQAHNIYNGLKNLHDLLDQVPTYSESDRPTVYRPSGSTPTPDVTVDDPIHGEKYFRVNRRNHNFYRDNY